MSSISFKFLGGNLHISLLDLTDFFWQVAPDPGIRSSECLNGKLEGRGRISVYSQRTEKTHSEGRLCERSDTFRHINEGIW